MHNTPFEFHSVSSYNGRKNTIFFLSMSEDHDNDFSQKIKTNRDKRSYTLASARVDVCVPPQRIAASPVFGPCGGKFLDLPSTRLSPGLYHPVRTGGGVPKSKFMRANYFEKFQETNSIPNVNYHIY